jgi:gluconolactonase
MRGVEIAMQGTLNGWLAVFLLLIGCPTGIAQILPPGATVERLARGFSFTEGPLYDGRGGVYFTDIQRNDIVRYDIAAGTTQIVDPNSGGANGLYFDTNGQIVSMDGARRQVSRRSAADVSVVEAVLANEWNDLPFNSPNDLVIAGNGGIYFTDPDYQNRRAQPEGVYYLSPDGQLSQILAGFRRPNGAILSPDERTFYLAVEAEFRIMAYDLLPNGLPTNERLFALTNVDRDGNPIRGITNGPDGMTVDPAGNLYAAVQNAIWAWTPAGERLFELPVPEDPTNVTLGGDDGKTLFITAQTSLYGIGLNIVPEPNSAMLAWLGGAMVGIRRRRSWGSR